MRGFSLLEVLITVVILAFIVGAIFAVLNVGDKSWNTDLGLLELRQEARRGMDGMTRELRQIDPDQAITIGAGLDDISFSVTDDITDPNTPVTYSITYSRDGGSNQILRENPSGSGTTTVLANNISALSFCSGTAQDSCDSTYSAGENIWISLTASNTVLQRPLSFSLTEQVEIRNE